VKQIMLRASAPPPHLLPSTSLLVTRQPKFGSRATEAGEPGTGAHGHAGTRVLVVEDDWFAGMDMDAALDLAGFDVLGVVISAEEAIEAAGESRPDLILMDVRLVGARDGVDAALEIGRRFGIRCLFVTAFVDPALRTRAEPARPIGWLTKPISGESLVAAVRAALARQ
jgi:DNA-binding NarL/FixJ family response regulator